jgi:hypothetical protein
VKAFNREGRLGIAKVAKTTIPLRPARLFFATFAVKSFWALLSQKKAQPWKRLRPL